MGFVKGGGCSGTGSTTVTLNVAGIVTSGAPVTDNALVRYSGTDGYVVEETAITVDNYGDMTLLAGRTVDGIDISVADAYNKAQLTAINSAYIAADAYLQTEVTNLNTDSITQDAYLQTELTNLNADSITEDAYQQTQLTAINSDVVAHVDNTSNPHNVTADQLNALQYADIDNYATLSLLDSYAELTLLDSYATTSHAATHITSGSDEIDGDQLDIDWNPSSYTPTTSPSEVSSADHLTAHLAGIDGYLLDLGNDDGYLQSELTNLNADSITEDAYQQTQLTAINSDVVAHVDNTSNPHNVTAAQLNALQFADIDNYAKLPLTILDSYATTSHIDTHLGGGSDSLYEIATRAPTATDDVNDGYLVGYRWIDTVDEYEYVLIDNTASAAVWSNLSSGGGGAAASHASTHITDGSDEIDGDQLDIDWTPTNYEPDTTPSEASDADHLTAHLAGIDAYLSLAKVKTAHESFRDVTAVNTGVISTQSSDFDISSGFLHFPCPMFVSIVNDVGKTADYDAIIIDGYDARGNTVTATYQNPSPAARSTLTSDEYGANAPAFAGITRIRNTGTLSTGTVNINTQYLGLIHTNVVEVYKMVVDGAHATQGGTTNLSQGTLRTNPWPSGGTIEVWYKYEENEDDII